MQLRYRVFTRSGQLVGATVDATDAAVLVGTYGDGATVRLNRRVVFRNGKDGEAADSYDAAAEIIYAREAAR